MPTVKGTFCLENTDWVQATMTLTMPLREWKALAEQLHQIRSLAIGDDATGYTAVQTLRTLIYDLVQSADQEFMKTHTEQGG